jgi:hypothetical protein
LPPSASDDSIALGTTYGAPITERFGHCHNNAADPKNNVDLYAFQGSPQVNKMIAADQKPLNQDRKERISRLEFVAPEASVCYLRIVNRGPGVAKQCVVTLTEKK